MQWAREQYSKMKRGNVLASWNSKITILFEDEVHSALFIWTQSSTMSVS